MTHPTVTKTISRTAVDDLHREAAARRTLAEILSARRRGRPWRPTVRSLTS